MKHIKRFEDHKAINESWLNADHYNVHMHHLLTCLFVNSLPNYKHTINHIRAVGSCNLENTQLLNQIHKILKNKGNILKRILFNYKPEYKNINCVCEVFLNQDNSFDIKLNDFVNFTIVNIKCVSIDELKKMNKENSTDPNNLPTLRITFAYAYTSFFKPLQFQKYEKMLTIDYNKLLHSYDINKENYFSDELFQQVWTFIEEYQIQTSKNLLIDFLKELMINDYEDLWSLTSFSTATTLLGIPVTGVTAHIGSPTAHIGSPSTIKNSKNHLYKGIVDTLDYYRFNKTFFAKIINQFVKDNDKFPDIFSMYLLHEGCDADIPMKCLSEPFMTKVESSAKLLALCRKNMKSLYDYLKKNRQDDWKTDLSADMGELGF